MVFFKPLTDDKLYKVKSADLRNAKLKDSELTAHVVDLGHFNVTDGMEFDKHGNLYMGDMEKNAIIKLSSKLEKTVLMTDARLLWPGSYAVSKDGYLYISTSQVHTAPPFNDGVDKRTLPYGLFRLKIRSVTHDDVAARVFKMGREDKSVRYLLRPLISADRLTARPDGRVEYHFRRPDPSGRTSWVTDGTTWCRRLATLIPPRRSHTTRFHGVLSSAHVWRSRVVPSRPTAAELLAKHGLGARPPPAPSAPCVPLGQLRFAFMR